VLSSEVVWSGNCTTAPGPQSRGLFAQHPHPHISTRSPPSAILSLFYGVLPVLQIILHFRGNVRVYFLLITVFPLFNIFLYCLHLFSFLPLTFAFFFFNVSSNIVVSLLLLLFFHPQFLPFSFFRFFCFFVVRFSSISSALTF
jgi:hypothetical protein